MPAQPIRRNQHIVTLSHDHHVGLLFCWKIRQGLKRQADLPRITRYVRYFWQHNLEPHFREEEDILFILPGDKKIGQALDEHRQIRSLITAITGDPTHNADAPVASPDAVQQLTALADAVDKHIRFEERDLFPYLEQTLSPDQLADIGARLNNEPHAPDTYPDEFWAGR